MMQQFFYEQLHSADIQFGEVNHETAQARLAADRQRIYRESRISEQAKKYAADKLQAFIAFARRYRCLREESPNPRAHANFAARYEQVTGVALPEGGYTRKRKATATATHTTLVLQLHNKALPLVPESFQDSITSSGVEKNGFQIREQEFIWTLIRDHGFRIRAAHEKPKALVLQMPSPPSTPLTLRSRSERPDYSRIVEADGSVSPAEDTGFRFRRSKEVARAARA